MSSDLSTLTDETLLRFYENIREQIAADLRSDYRLLGEAAKQRAAALYAEIRRRRLNAEPIYWPGETA